MGGGGEEVAGGMVKFYETAITPSCRAALTILGRQPFINEFYLAGGTALALQIGHRLSTDLDWFSTHRTLLALEREEIFRLFRSSVQISNGYYFTMNGITA
jgi:hypothetical protein